jgi:hypothetical protein
VNRVPNVGELQQSFERHYELPGNDGRSAQE